MWKGILADSHFLIFFAVALEAQIPKSNKYYAEPVSEQKPPLDENSSKAIRSTNDINDIIVYIAIHYEQILHPKRFCKNLREDKSNKYHKTSNSTILNYIKETRK